MLSGDGPIRIESGGVVLREWRLEDVPDLVSLYDTAEMDLRTPVASPFTPEDARGYVERAHQRRREGSAVQLAVTEDGGTALGEVLAFSTDDPAVVELGYALAACHRGRGLARRALTALMAELDASASPRARLMISPDNLPSRRVAEACGFVLTGQPLVEQAPKGRTVQLATWERPL